MLQAGCSKSDMPDQDTFQVKCVHAAELLLRRAWFPGETDLDQLSKIFQALGTANQDVWPGCTALPQYVEFQATPAPPLRATFRQARLTTVLHPSSCLNQNRG